MKSLLPQKYDDAKRGFAAPTINITINGASGYLERQEKLEKAIEAEVVDHPGITKKTAISGE